MNEVETTPAEDSGSQDTAPAGFLDSLPEELRAEPSLRNFSDTAGLAKSYVHAQRMIGADKIALPGTGSNEDDWRPIWQKLGAPDKPEGYEIQGDAIAEEQLQSFKDQAYAAGLTGKQAQSMAEFMQSQSATSFEADEARTAAVAQEYESDLRQEFGLAYEQKIDRAQSAARAMGIDSRVFDDIRLDNGLPLGDHPFILKLFAGLADQLGEDTLEGSTTDLVMTPDEAGRKIAELTAPNTPYWDKSHPQHSIDVDEVLRLREHQFPDTLQG